MYKNLVDKMIPIPDAEPKITFPEVDLRNFDKKVEAVIKEYKNNLRSRESAQEALDLNPEEEKDLMSEDQLRDTVESVMFHAPAVENKGSKDASIDKLVEAFSDRGWL